MRIKRKPLLMSRKTIAPNSFAAIRVFAFKPFANCAVMSVFDFKVSVSVVAKLYKEKEKKKSPRMPRMPRAGEGRSKRRGSVRRKGRVYMRCLD